VFQEYTSSGPPPSTTAGEYRTAPAFVLRP
jgi:hypothetical protein